jgi:DNA-binding MarR family transcriptional regulator
MSTELSEVQYERFWRRLQQAGLNSYEARSYLVLVGHPRFKALELASRARVPRQKIYEVLDSLVEKGFAQVVQDRTKLFSAVEPGLALPTYMERRREQLEQELADERRHGLLLAEELRQAYTDGQGARGTLDYLQIVNDPSQIALHYRSMLGQVAHSYIEFSRPPYAVDPLDEQMVKDAAARGVACRILIEAGSLDDVHRTRLDDYRTAGIVVREVDALPMKLAVFDGREGLVSLLDPVVTRPSWMAVVFNHDGFGEAMAALFDDRWRRAGSAIVELNDGK